jgi:hypothetical protein
VCDDPAVARVGEQVGGGGSGGLACVTVHSGEAAGDGEAVAMVVHLIAEAVAAVESAAAVHRPEPVDVVAAAAAAAEVVVEAGEAGLVGVHPGGGVWVGEDGVDRLQAKWRSAAVRWFVTRVSGMARPQRDACIRAAGLFTLRPTKHRLSMRTPGCASR